jgi:hypothetical protein
VPVAARNSLFAGYAPAVFKYATRAWKKICGVSPAAEFAGSAPTAGPRDRFKGN